MSSEPIKTAFLIVRLYHCTYIYSYVIILRMSCPRSDCIILDTLVVFITYLLTYRIF